MDPHISIEREFRSQGFKGWLLGCDEVGRGPLAGPATVACVAFPIDIDWHDPFYALLDDPKKSAVPSFQKSSFAPLPLASSISRRAKSTNAISCKHAFGA